MNMNATAQMVTTTQRGCETDRDLVRKFEVAVKALKEIERDSNGWEKSIAESALSKISSYPVPPHTMTNRGHLRDIG